MAASGSDNPTAKATWALLALALVFVVGGVIGIFTSVATGNEEVVTATRVVFENGDEKRCGGLNAPCKFLIELTDVREPNPCRDSENTVWRENACWPDGLADELPLERLSMVEAGGVEIGDTVEVVYDPDDLQEPANIAGSRGRVVPIGLIVAGCALAGVAIWRRL